MMAILNLEERASMARTIATIAEFLRRSTVNGRDVVNLSQMVKDLCDIATRLCTEEEHDARRMARLEKMSHEVGLCPAPGVITEYALEQYERFRRLGGCPGDFYALAEAGGHSSEFMNVPVVISQKGSDDGRQEKASGKR